MLPAVLRVRRKIRQFWGNCPDREDEAAFAEVLIQATADRLPARVGS
jgi:hypothetical protein